MIRTAIRMTLAVSLLLLFAYCANMSTPTGGPKDIYPPVVLESEPPNYNTHFNSGKITLKFNEFVSVSDVMSEVFISPPLQNTPEIKTRGKSVIIYIEEELLDSTTYSIYFGKSIKDITEGNPIENYNYVFSTGDKIDSLSVIGEVIDAFSLKPREDVLVMLYEDDNDTIPFDSLPYLVKPAYLTRTNTAGFYLINNLRDGDYMLFTLADINLSSTYDGGDEEVGFLDSLVSPEYYAPEAFDTTLMDSLTMIAQGDSLVDAYQQAQAEALYDIGEEMLEELPDDTSLLLSDLIIADSIPEDTTDESFYTLFMFKEIPDTIQKLLVVDKPRKQILRFIFRYPAEDVKITPLTPVPNEWMLEEWNKGKDTLRYYILSDKLDTISLRIWQDTTVFDTVSFSLVEKEMPQKKKDMEEAQIMKLFTHIRNPFPFNDTLEIKTAYPFREVDFSRFILTSDEDTVEAFFDIFDPAGRMIRLNYKYEEQTTYNLFIPDSALVDILGRSNDTTEFRFKTNSYEDYGLYVIHIVNTSSYDQVVIQLMTESEKLVRQNIIFHEETIKWDLLKPGKYIIKAFADLNHNGKWDTGDFLEKRQPEPVIYFPGVIEVRAGWSFEEDWEVEFK